MGVLDEYRIVIALPQFLACCYETQNLKLTLGAKYLVFLLLSFPQNERKIILVFICLYIFWGKCVYFSIFEWYVVVFDIIVNVIIIQKLKSKHTSLKKYTNWAKLTEKKLIYFTLFLREQEKKKQNISQPSDLCMMLDNKSWEVMNKFTCMQSMKLNLKVK